MTDILIRPAEPPDLPAITAIYDEAVRFGTGSFELEPPGLAEMRRRMQPLLNAGYPYLVAMVAALSRAMPTQDPIGQGLPIGFKFGRWLAARAGRGRRLVAGTLI